MTVVPADTGIGIKNSENIIFPPFDQAHSISHSGFFDSAGRLIARACLAVPKNITAGTGIGFGAGTLTLAVRTWGT
jgi:hypothetical protein